VYIYIYIYDCRLIIIQGLIAVLGILQFRFDSVPWDWIWVWVWDCYWYWYWDGHDDDDDFDVEYTVLWSNYCYIVLYKHTYIYKYELVGRQ